MRIPAGVVGTAVGPRAHTIDARWLMAYAAALGETAPSYFDTTRSEGIIAHPLFPVCYEWPLALVLRAKALTRRIAARSVHATHDLRLHRRPRAGDRLHTRATITSVEPRAPGAYVVTRFETVDAQDDPVSTTDYGSIYRGVEVEGMVVPHPLTLPGPGEEGPPPAGSGPREEHPSPPPDWSAAVMIPATLAHVYSECARIWNPIHTDRAVARAAGLPEIILHGTATLALAVATLLRREGAGASAAVTRIACRFGGMVRLPSEVTVLGWSGAQMHGERVIAFQVLTPDGRPAIRDGRVTLTHPDDSVERHP